MQIFLLYNTLFFVINLALAGWLIYRERGLQKKIASVQRSESIADRKAKEIIEQANKKGLETVARANYFVDDQTNRLNQALDKISKDNLKASEGVFKEVVSKLHSRLEIKLEQRVDTMFANLEQEIEKYKQERIAGIDKEIAEKVLQISTEVLNKTIPIEDQNEQIILALEQAKKEGILSH